MSNLEDLSKPELIKLVKDQEIQIGILRIDNTNKEVIIGAQEKTIRELRKRKSAPKRKA